MASITRPTRFYSNKQEKQVAKTIGGKQVSNSGATAFNKGDCANDLFLIECKTCITEKKSFSIKREWLCKNEEEMFEMGKSYNALAFNFGPDTDNYYIINEKLFVLLTQLAQEYETPKITYWNKTNSGDYECNNCGYILISDEEDLYDFKYCPMCGHKVERR